MARQHFHNSNTEWSLFPPVFNELMTKWGEPDKDIFASRLTYKVPQYVSWKPDPGVIAIDAFIPDWSRYKLIYCFPPFSLIGKVLQYIQEGNTTAILVISYWPAQFLFCTSPPVAEITTIGNQDAKINPPASLPTRRRSPIVSQTSNSWLFCVRLL